MVFATVNKMLLFKSLCISVGSVAKERFIVTGLHAFCDKVLQININTYNNYHIRFNHHLKCSN